MAKRSAKKRPAPQRVSGLQGPKDRREVMDALARAFTDPCFMERHLGRGLWTGDVFDPEHTRVVVAGGKVVAGVVMGPRMMRFGPVAVPAMTIGPVGTHDHHRKRGYAATAMNDASRYMKDNGFLLAYLGGIEHFYYRFGYYPCLARSSVSFNRDAAKKEARPGRLRAMRTSDIPAVRRLYDRATANRICAAARDTMLWRWLLGSGGRTWLFPKAKVILDARGKLCGYLTLNERRNFGIKELVVRQDEAACRAAVGALVSLARRHEVKDVGFPMAWDDAFAVFLRQFVPAEFKAHSNPTGSQLMKIVDFPALMHRLQPLFAERRKAAGAALAPVSFRIESEIGAVGIDVTRGSVRIGAPKGRRRVRVPGRWLSGLLTGYYGPGEVAARKGAVIPRSLVPAMDTLFPRGWPFIYQGDNY